MSWSTFAVACFLASENSWIFFINKSFYDIKKVLDNRKKVLYDIELTYNKRLNKYINLSDYVFNIKKNEQNY